MTPCVYVLTNRINTVLYVGVTSDLKRRAWLHRMGVIEGFSKRYAMYKLVYYEEHGSMVEAIAREKQLKSGSRHRKVRLIREINPGWRDLYFDL